MTAHDKAGPGATPGGNRLGAATSPYLLQHAHNPVDWHEWGADAFDAARRRDVPIFLSVGYATCYWCHVMERESFEDAETGRLMSELFVCVKVDREERPDVDDLYMNATQLMTGHGGWPMSVFLDPDSLRPFYCGTYFPAEARSGLPSFSQVLRGMSDAWRTQRAEVTEQCERLAEAVAEQLATRAEPRAIGSEEVTKAVTQLLRMFDATHGGFGSAPKFPQPAFLDLLLQTRGGAAADATREVMDRALRTTLDRMAIGGLHDQAGGGFHRYSVDATWTVPHFEKMLYDNAQLAAMYARAASVYDDAYYRDVVRRTLDYALREMRHEDGGFYSAQDAEVDGREGLNYLWTPEELTAPLGEDDAAWAAEVYGLTRGPNFRDPHHAEEPARNILRLDQRPDRMAASLGMTAEAFAERLASINERLHRARIARRQPRLDDKVLAAWNGLMISGLAVGADSLGEVRYLDAAEQAAAFTRSSLWEDEPGALLRSWRDGRRGGLGFLEDAAFVLAGLCDLAEAQRRRGRDASETLDFARRVLRHADRDFGDGEGGYFDTRADQSDLFVRARTTYDGALPSGSTQIVNALLALDRLLPGEGYADRAVSALRSISAAIASSPLAAAVATRAVYAALASGVPPGSLEFAPREPDSQDTADPAGPNPVQVFAEVERVSLAPGEPAEFRVLLRVAPGYHVVAARPALEGESFDARELRAFRAGLVGGRGVRVYADYPSGEPYGVEGVGRFRVYTGDTEFDIALEREGDWEGRPLVTLTFQACSDSACLPPRTVELDVALDPVT